MKTKQLISLLLVLIFAISCAIIPANATNCDTCNVFSGDFCFIFDEDTSDVVRARVVSDLTGIHTAQGGEKGITCSLFGHKLETGTTAQITHKVRATSPRCLRDIINYEICTRCDYSNYTTISSSYIVCCN